MTSCAVDKVLVHLYHVLLAILCAGGIWLGLWLSKNVFPFYKNM